MSENRESVTYIGSRDSVGKEWLSRRWIFRNGTPLSVPDAFAKLLLATPDFIRSDDVGRPVTQLYPNGGKLLFKRWGALGDLIMFRAAVSALVRARPAFEVYLRCQERFCEIFKGDLLWKDVIPIGHPGFSAVKFDGICSFDQVAEADHRGDFRHRVDLFLCAMDKTPLVIEPSDWQIPIRPEVGEWVHRHMSNRGLLREQRGGKLVALQVRGSGIMKSLPPEIMQRIIREILAMGANVMLIESIETEAKLFVLDDRVYTMTHRDPLHCIEMLRHVDLAVTMDSGALWMAHSAPCPVLAILGPTRPAQRISMHPMYPNGARAVELNNLISCPACFEAARACSGTFACMRNQPDWNAAVRAIMTEVGSMLAGNIPLQQLAPAVAERV